MTFVLSKILWIIIVPLNIIVFFILFGRLILAARPRFGRRLISIGLILLFLCGLDFLPKFLTSILENRIPAGQIPERIDGIIVLAGMVDMEASRKGYVELTEQSDRIVEGVILARKYPEAKLVLTGSSGFLVEDPRFIEADYLKRLAVSLGIEEERIIIERKARNTHEHACALAGLLSGDGQWILVTSAFHMPRSIGCFKKQGLKVVPFPVDYQAKSEEFNHLSLASFLPSAGNLSRLSIALHEWLGLIAYRLMGYTDSLFPRTA